MLPRPKSFVRWLLALICFTPLLATGQTLNINNDVQTYTTLTNTAVTMSGKSELRITGTGDPITGCTINLTSADSWFIMTTIVPSTVVSTFLSRVQVNGAAAVVDSNVRVVQYGMGAVVIPHAPGFAAMEVFEGKSFTGASRGLQCYVEYGDVLLGALNDKISSFKLKRGYTATIGQHTAGTGTSRNYVAQDGDLEVGVLPSALNDSISFIRIFPWRWTSKKGIGGDIASGLNVRWDYNWNLNRNSTRDIEYVPIRQNQYWPGLDQDWAARGSSHLLGYNEPDKADQANMSVATAISAWPDLLGTGLRLGSPAVSDGGLNWWLYDFVNQADSNGLRVDYVAVHYYRCVTPSNYALAASQLYDFLKGIYDQVKRPLWVTEFNNGASWTGCGDPTAAQQQGAVNAMINMLEDAWFVERYAIFNWVEDARRVKWDSGGLTSAGDTYAAKWSNLGYMQQWPGSLIGTAAHYSFDGDLRDALINGNDAMGIGAPDFVAGKYGQALSFNGTSDCLQVSSYVGDSTDFTFTAWVKWGGGSNWQRIFDFGEGGTENYFFLTPKSGSSTLRFTIRSGTTDQIVETSTLPTVGTWTHVAVTVSGNTGKIFVNGTVRATNNSMSFNPGDLGTRYNYIGKSQYWQDPLFKGELDDVRFFASALTEAQIAQIAGNAPPQFSATTYNVNATKLQQYTGSMAPNASGGSGTRTFAKATGPAWLAVAADGALTGVPATTDGGVNRFLIRVTDSIGALSTATLDVTVADPPGLVARYALDSNANASPGTLHGTAAGSPAYVAGVNSLAMDFDGTNDYVTLPAGIASESEITIAMWFSRDSTAGWQRLFDFGTGTTEYMFLSPRSASSTIHFGIKNGGAEQSLSTPSLPTGQWVHVAVTLGANVGKLYVNGALADTDTITIKPTDFLHEFNYLGDSQFTADPLFDGRIDEFVIFNKALDAAQIAALANAANLAPSFTTDPMSKPAATPAQIYEQTIAGGATDPNAGSTLTYSKVSGPAWLTVSPDGRISGVPGDADAGTNRFVVRVSDAAGLADDAALNIVVGNPSGLIAHHQFHDSTADNIGGTAGITTTGSPAYASGFFDRAIDFDGTDNVVQLRAGLLNGVTDMTIAARVRWDGGNDWQRLFDFGNGTNQYLFLTPRSGSSSVFGIKNGTGTDQNLVGPALTIGEWASVAVTLIGNSGTMYLNGAAVATGSITIDPSAFAPAINYLGDSQYAADPLFNGLIDDLRIYNRGLAAAEISALAVPPAAVSVPDSSFAAWAAGYSFPGGQSDALADADNDGLSNGWEYLTGSNPLLAASGSIPPSQVMTAAALGLGNTGKTYLAIQPRIRKQHLGVAVVPEAATTLADLALPAAAAHALQAGAPVADGEYEIFTYYFDTALQDSPGGAGFIRVRATLN